MPPPSTRGSGPCPRRGAPHHTAGASSAGAAALVAAGVVPLAHANDGGGSIRIPASVNGLVGLKPTRDRFAQDKFMRDMPVRIVSDGVLTRSVRDTAAFARESEKVYRALHLPPIGAITRPGRARLKIAVVTDGISVDASPEVSELTLKTARLLEELGHHVEHVAPPASPSLPDDFLLYWSALAMAMVRSGRVRYGRTWDAARLDDLTHGLARHATRNAHRLPGRDRPAQAGPAYLRGVLPALRRRALADAGRRDPEAGPPRPDPAPSTSSSSGCWPGWRSRRCRTSPAIRRSPCRSRRRPRVCRRG